VFRNWNDPAKGALIRAAASTQPFDIFRVMESHKLNRRERFILRWSPLLLTSSVVWLFLSLLRGPISFLYILISGGIGLLYAGLLILDYWKKPSPGWTLLSPAILFGGIFLTNAIFFPNERALKWNAFSSQYFAIVLVMFFGLAWLCRQRIMKSNSQGDVEQLVGPERGKFVP